MFLRALPLALLVALLPACDNTMGPDGSSFAYEVSIFAALPGEVTGIVGLNDLGQAVVGTAEGYWLRDREEWVGVPMRFLRILTDDGVVVGKAEGGVLRTFEDGIVTDLGEGDFLGVDRDGRIWAKRDGAVFVRIGDAWEERTFAVPERDHVFLTRLGGSGLLGGIFLAPGIDEECFLSDGEDWVQIGDSNNCAPVEIEDTDLLLVSDLHGAGSWTVWDAARGEALRVNEVVETGLFSTGLPFDMNAGGTVVAGPKAQSNPLFIQRADTLYGAGVLFDTTAWSVTASQGAAINDDGEILVMGSEAGSGEPLLLLLTPTG